MNRASGSTLQTPRRLRCAIYTRKSSEEGLDMEFNSLDAQREACEAYIASQRSEGWAAIREPYDDGGVSGGTLERPALQRLLADVEAGLIDVIVVYKIDRLSRSLMDFAKLVDIFDRNQVTFVSVMGDRITLRAGRHHFFDEMSFKTAMSSIASAKSFFSLAFSSSSVRSRLASVTSRPPNLAFHL